MTLPSVYDIIIHGHLKFQRISGWTSLLHTTLHIGQSNLAFEVASGQEAHTLQVCTAPSLPCVTPRSMVAHCMTRTLKRHPCCMGIMVRGERATGLADFMSGPGTPY